MGRITASYVARINADCGRALIGFLYSYFLENASYGPLYGNVKGPARQPSLGHSGIGQIVLLVSTLGNYVIKLARSNARNNEFFVYSSDTVYACAGRAAETVITFSW